MNRTAASLVLVLLSGSLAACGTSSGDSRTPSSSGSGSERTLTVYAASSLTAAFTDLGERFEAAHRGVRVRFNFGGSSDLVAQIAQGAPADVFASADSDNMAKAVADKAVAGAPVSFASNTLEIAVPPDNPADVETLQDLARPGTKLVLCAPEVPCGSAAQKVERASGVDLSPVSEEQSVTDVLTKVETGEADAGLVYVTDVQAAGDRVKGIRFSASSAALNTYPIAALADSEHRALATAFVRLVTGREGQSVLAAAGFAKP
jgi:molybdate transport system substrate-binding protein